MISGWMGWAKGRMLWLPAVAWAAALIIVYTQWWQWLDGPWAPHDDSYYVTLLEVGPVLAGLVSIWGILPRMDWIDAQAVTHPQRRDLVAMVALIGAFALISPLARWLFALSPFYTTFVPPAFTVADPAQLDDALPYGVIWQYVPHIAGVLGLAVLLTGILGRVFGPILGFLGYVGVLFIQGHRLAPMLIPRMLNRTAPDVWVTPTTGAIIPVAVIAIGLTIFRLSNSGTRRPGSYA